MERREPKWTCKCQSRQVIVKLDKQGLRRTSQTSESQNGNELGKKDKRESKIFGKSKIGQGSVKINKSKNESTF